MGAQERLRCLYNASKRITRKVGAKAMSNNVARTKQTQIPRLNKITSNILLSEKLVCSGEMTRYPLDCLTYKNDVYRRRCFLRGHAGEMITFFYFWKRNDERRDALQLREILSSACRSSEWKTRWNRYEFYTTTKYSSVSSHVRDTRYCFSIVGTSANDDKFALLPRWVRDRKLFMIRCGRVRRKFSDVNSN